MEAGRGSKRLLKGRRNRKSCSIFDVTDTMKFQKKIRIIKDVFI